MTKKTKIVLLTLWLLTITGSSVAATYYVSTTGSGTICSAALPCSMSFAMTNAVAGDTWLVADGIYNAGTGNGGDMRTPLLNPSNSGALGSPIVFRAANRLGAEITCTSTGTPNTCIPLGSSGRNYITYDGFRIYSDNGPAEVWFSNNSVGCVLKNSDIRGYSGAWGGADNIAGVMPDHTTDLTIQNCTIHGYIETSGNHNTAGILTYADSGLVVENCTFYENTGNIYNKYSSTNATYRNNLLLPPVAPGENNVFVQNYIGAVTEMSWYQNIVIGGLNGLNFDLAETDGNSFTVYNNTFYGQTGAAGYPRAAIVVTGNRSSAWSASNNIIQKSVSSGMVVWTQAVHAPALLDYNDYYMSSGTPTWIGDYYDTACTQTSLAAWRSGCGFDGNSVNSDPHFINASGNYNLAADFKRTDYPTDGRGGAYPSVMGAYITGDEVVGYTPYTPAAAPLSGVTLSGVTFSH